jgi:iron complex outermembrane receptor protein
MALGAAAALLLPVAGFAQSTPPVTPPAAQAGDEATLGEVVVTARKFNETLLTTPVTVTAFTAEDMQTRGIENLTDVANFTPGLKLDATAQSRNDRSNQTLIIRGMTPTFNGNVSIFIDGAPVVGNGYVEGVDELERVEVLKGPQSATFGRATFGGAVNLVTKDPTAEPHAGVDAAVESYGGYNVKAYLEGTLIPDFLTGMLQLKSFHTDGDYVNAANSSETIGAQATYALSGTLKATPMTGLTMKLFGDYWIDHDGPGATAILPHSSYNCAAGAAGAALNYVCGALPMINLSTLAVNDTIDAAVRNQLINNSTHSVYYMPGMPGDFSDHAGLERKAYHIHGIIDYDIPALDAVFSSISSYDNDKYEYIGDIDNQDTTNIPNPFYTAAEYGVLQPYVNWPAYVQFLQWGYSQEFRLQGGNSGPFHWLLGGSYVYQESGFVAGALLDFGALDFQLPTTTATRTTGGFFSLGYDVTKQFTLTFDGRLENEKQYLYNLTDGRVGQANESFTNFIPRVLARYEPTTDLMVYASYSVGVNPGGFNDNLVSFNAAQQAYLENLFGITLKVSPEKLYNYELGVKGKFLDDTLQVTADVYHADWKNQVTQNAVTVKPPGAIIATQLEINQNVGLTDLNGVELEVSYKPIAHLTLNGAVGYTPSDIRKFICTVCQLDITGSTNVTGNQLPTVAALTSNLGVEYRQPMFTDMEGFGRVDWLYSGRIYEDFTDLAWIPPNSKVNLRAGVVHDKTTIEGYVNNLFDDLTYIDAQQNSDLIHGGNAVIAGLPLRRTFGLRFIERF